MVFDRTVALPGCAWTKEHADQGFARRDRCVCFGTLLEFGEADVTVYLGPYEPRQMYMRVIAVPIDLPSGEVAIEGPEDEVGSQHFVRLNSGHYQLTAAQVVIDEDRERIDLYFEKLAEPGPRSRIIVADDALTPPEVLVETAEVA
jgi:hypothetical protein